MTDLLQDVRDYFSDRFSNPLWISIIVSWLLFNWSIPIAAIFETAKFNVGYILEYKNQTTHWCLITLPLLSGLIYSIFSSSAKETLEVLSKTIRNLITKIDRKGVFYKSISIVEHEKQLSRLKRQLQRIERDKEQLNEAIIENTKLIEEKTDLTSTVTKNILELDKAKSEAIKAKKEMEALESSLSSANQRIALLEHERENFITEQEKSSKEQNKKNEILSELATLKEKHQKATLIIKELINKHPASSPDSVESFKKVLYSHERSSAETKKHPFTKRIYYEKNHKKSNDKLENQLNEADNP